MTFRSLLIAALMTALFVTVVDFVPAQTLTSATVTGFVADGSGAAVPNATIRVAQTETDTVRTVQTGLNGEYRFPFLKPGDYTISAEGEGFTASSVTVHLLIGQEQSINLTLGVQAVQQ